MPAITTIRDDILGMMSLESLDHGPAGLQTRILNDTNAVLQEIYTMLPKQWWMEDARSERVRAPTTVSLTVTQNSKVITFAGYDSTWQGGCSIVIDGDPKQNRLITDAGASVTLQKPYSGSSGAKSAVVYQDVVNCGSEVEAVLSPVVIENHGELIPCAHERDLQMHDPSGSASSTNHGSRPGGLFPLDWNTKAIDVPSAFLIERHTLYSTSLTTPRIRFSTLPDQELVVNFRVKLTGLPAARVASMNDTRDYLVPFQYTESVLLPLVRERFSSWPSFTGDTQRIDKDAEKARQILVKLNPKGYTPRRIGTGGDW